MLIYLQIVLIHFVLEKKASHELYYFRLCLVQHILKINLYHSTGEAHSHLPISMQRGTSANAEQLQAFRKELEGSLWPNVFLRRAWAMRHAQETGSDAARGREVGTVPPDPCGSPLLTWLIFSFLPLSSFKHFTLGIFWLCWVFIAVCGPR